MSLSHDQLVQRAVKWLRGQNCGIVFDDRFCPRTYTGEQPDAIGWRNECSILIECKASRADFHSDKNKKFRQTPELGMGDWRFYMCPPRVINPSDLPEDWGLLWCYPSKVEKVFGVPKGNTDWGKYIHESNRDDELRMMYSALRRMELRGHLQEIYEPLRG